MKTSKSNANLEVSNELQAIEEDIRELEEDFGDLGLEDDDGGGDAEESSSEIAELEAAIGGTEFERPVAAESSSFSVLDIADEAASQEALQEGLGDLIKKGVGLVGDVVDKAKNLPGNIVDKAKAVITGQIRRKAAKIIKRLVWLVKRYRKYAACAPAVTVAVVAFRAGKYGTALKLGYSAYKCIKKRS